MKKFSKLFLSCAAVAALTAAVATSAMAEEVALTGELTGTYYTADTADENAGKLVITPPSDMVEGEQATLLVYDAAAAATKVTSDSVVGIDQAADAAFTKNGLKNTVVVPEEGSKTYTVKLGYYVPNGKDGTSFTVKTGTLTLGESTADYGNVNGDNMIDYQDAIVVLDAEIGNVTLTAEQIVNADVVVDGVVDYQDAIDILNYEVGNDSNTAILRGEAQ